MSFDGKTFAASFLEQLTTGITEREAEAKEYKEQQEAKAERNAALIRERQLRATEAAALGKKIINLGATPGHVRTALASGMTGIKELYDKLNAAANSKGVQSLGEDDIEAIVSMPTTAVVNQAFIDDSLEQFAQRTFGVLPSRKEPTKETKKPSAIRTLFGLDSRAKVDERLSERDYMDGLSIADINEMSRQAEYKSLIPDATMTFLDIEQFNPKAQMDFNEALTEAVDDATTGTKAEAYIRQRVSALGTGASMEQIEAEELLAKQTLEAKAAKTVVELYARTYALGGFFKNDLALKQIEDNLGSAYLNDLLTAYDFEAKEDEEGDETETTTETSTTQQKPTQSEQSQENSEDTSSESDEGDRDADPEEITQTQEGASEAEKAALLAKTFPTRPPSTKILRTSRWDRKYEGKVDPETGKAIIVEPRPPKGQGAKEIEVGGRRKTTKIVDDADAWDMKYGDTHNPNGMPKL